MGRDAASGRRGGASGSGARAARRASSNAATVATSKVSASMATITPTDGMTAMPQPRPLAYIGDTAPGQASGNNLNLNGGLWLEVPASS